MNDFRLAELKIGSWTVIVEEMLSNDNDLYERCYIAFKRDSSNKLITEYFEGILEMVEFVQEQEGLPVFPYQEVETMMRQALCFWERQMAK